MTYRLPPDISRRMDDATEMVKRRQRELDAQDAAEQAARDKENARHRAAYLARLEAGKQAEQAARDAAREQELAPTKRREMLAWLVAHPDKSEADFAGVWPHVKELLKIGDRDAAIEREIEAQRQRRFGS